MSDAFWTIFHDADIVLLYISGFIYIRLQLFNDGFTGFEWISKSFLKIWCAIIVVGNWANILNGSFSRYSFSISLYANIFYDTEIASAVVVSYV